MAMDDELREVGLGTTVDPLMALLVESAIKRPQQLHVPMRAWQEKFREISWLCSCGAINKHVPLPANLRCVDDKENNDA
jgi:hypothetical protein